MPTNAAYILVVGGAGYIGSHMVLTLQDLGYQVIVLDNLSKGYRDAISAVEFVHGDMSDTALLQHLFTRYTITTVMHFAAFIEVEESSLNPLHYYMNNVSATLNLLQVMLTYGVKQFIFSSSAAVYGHPQTLIINESHPLAPINPYGRSKWMVEEIIKDLGKSYGLNYAILRYFNAAGADPKKRCGERHHPETHLIPLVLQVAQGKRDSFTIYGLDWPTADGTCVRDFVHVMDICQAHHLALQALAQGKQAMICNIGTGTGYSVLQVIHAARNITGHPIPFLAHAARIGDPAILVADATWAHQELHWRPRYVGLDPLIQHAWAFMKNNG